MTPRPRLRTDFLKLRMALEIQPLPRGTLSISPFLLLFHGIICVEIILLLVAIRIVFIIVILTSRQAQDCGEEERQPFQASHHRVFYVLRFTLKEEGERGSFSDWHIHRISHLSFVRFRQSSYGMTDCHTFKLHVVLPSLFSISFPFPFSRRVNIASG